MPQPGWLKKVTGDSHTVGHCQPGLICSCPELIARQRWHCRLSLTQPRSPSHGRGPSCSPTACSPPSWPHCAWLCLCTGLTLGILSVQFQACGEVFVHNTHIGSNMLSRLPFALCCLPGPPEQQQHLGTRHFTPGTPDSNSCRGAHPSPPTGFCTLSSRHPISLDDSLCQRLPNCPLLLQTLRSPGSPPKC